MPTALDNGIRSPRALLAAVVRKLVAALRRLLKGMKPTITATATAPTASVPPADEPPRR